MSRIGKKPVQVPAGTKIKIEGALVRAEGPKGNLDLQVDPRIVVTQSENQVVCERRSDDRQARALHGLYRALIQNMVDGVTNGFEKKLEIVGVGYVAHLEEDLLSLAVGYSHSVHLKVPEGVSLTLPDNSHITVSGVDKQKVGQFAAEIRAVRKPEPYKGTGIRYAGEHVRRKAGKAFGSAG